MVLQSQMKVPKPAFFVLTGKGSPKALIKAVCICHYN